MVAKLLARIRNHLHPAARAAETRPIAQIIRIDSRSRANHPTAQPARKAHQ